MHPTRRRAVAPTLCLTLCLLLAACTGGGDEPVVEPTEPAPDPAAPEPVTLVIEHIEMATLSNAEILGVAHPEIRPKVAEDAVRSTRTALERYLTAQFAAPATRFSADPARSLVAPGTYDALIPEQRHGLGVVRMPAHGVVTGPARGSATVLFQGTTAYAVAIEYTARFEIVLADDSRHPVTQRGNVLFQAPQWGVTAFDLTLDAPHVIEPEPDPDADEGDGEPGAGDAEVAA